MVFSSIEFIYLFLIPVFSGFLILRHFRLESAIIYWLIAASLAFYAWWSPPHLLLLIGSITVNFLIHRALVRSPSMSVFAFGVILNLAVLGVFKYADFVLANVALITTFDVPTLNLLLPLAISFFTFQQISFLHDTLKGDVSRCDFKRYVLFVSFFPQLIAGPIVLQKDTVPQFRLETFRSKVGVNIAVGLTIFLIGLFKKIVLADGIAPTANSVFGIVDAGGIVSTADAWIGALAYTFQIYFDFSGYCDMALGLALFFGIRLPQNFNSPYKSASITEFWRRWHMTLSRFLRDYLYIPLGGNRSGVFGTKGNLAITMLLGGLWHGAGWNFVIWGALHGTYLMINHQWASSELSAKVRTIVPASAYVAFAWLLTMFCVVIAWVFFRAETFNGAMSLLSSMLGFAETTPFGSAKPLEVDTVFVLAMFAAMTSIVLMLPNCIEFLAKYRPALKIDRGFKKSKPRFVGFWRPKVGWATITAALGFAAIIQIYRLNGLTEFIYFNF